MAQLGCHALCMQLLHAMRNDITQTHTYTLTHAYLRQKANLQAHATPCSVVLLQRSHCQWRSIEICEQFFVLQICSNFVVL